MLRTLYTPTAVLTVMAALAAPLAAQTPPTGSAPAAPPAPAAPAAPAPLRVPAVPPVPVPGASGPTQAAPAAALPPVLTDLGITDARLQDGRRGGQRVTGTLPGGQPFQARLDEQSELRMIRVEGQGALPADIVARLVPDAVRANAIFAEFAQLSGIGRGEEGVLLFGRDAAGQDIRAGFSAEGTLQRFGRGDADRPGMGRDDDDRGRAGRDHGRDHGPKRRGHPEREDARRGPGDQGGPRPEGAMAPLDDGGVRTVLQDAGYTQPGAITRDGPRTEVEAVNPEGEPVTVTIGPRGVVVRELAR